MVKKSQADRLEDHSKRLLVLETAQLHFANQQSGMGLDIQRIREVLFGSDKPGEVSIKSQVNETNELVKDLHDRFEQSERETLKIRQDGFKRIEDLETWRENQKFISADTKGEWRKWIYGIVFFLLGFLAQFILMSR